MKTQFLYLPMVVSFSLSAQVYHGTLEVTGTDDASTSAVLAQASDHRITVNTSTNYGDYALNFPNSSDAATGVLISSIAENGGRNSGSSDLFASSSVSSSSFDTSKLYSIAIHSSTAADSNNETNSNVAFAFFSYHQWQAGHASNEENGGPLTLIEASDGIELGEQLNQSDPPNGVYTLSLNNASSADGILLVNAGKDEANYALSRANDDGTFTIYNDDNYANGSVYEADSIAFVYLPFSAVGTNNLVALGRIESDGTTNGSAGTFTLTKTDTGTWHLEGTHFSPDQGTLIISPEKAEEDNFISYQWDAAHSHYIIQNRNLLDYSLQDGSEADEVMFSFAFFRHEILYVDPSASSGIRDGNSWANAFIGVQDALAAASAGDSIYVAQSTYLPGIDPSDSFVLKSGVALYGGFPAGGTDFDERDPVAYLTILSGYNHVYHVLTADGTDSLARLDGFIITGGNADGSGENGYGGGLYCVGNASPVIAHCTFQSNYAENYGGAIYNAFSSPTFIHCSFQSSYANFLGGAIYNVSSSPSLTNCSFQSNYASSHGGAIRNNASSPTLTNCSFQSNYAAGYGGAIANSSSSPTFTNCSFQGNYANNSGTIANFSSSPSLTNCSFQGNYANNDGGAIYNWQSSPVLSNCILWNNTQNGVTSHPSASIFSDDASDPTYSHNLIQNWSATDLNAANDSSSDNLNGEDPANDPLFLLAVNPLDAPTTGGDLRLVIGSPAIDAGDDNASTSTSDLLGNPRFVGTIDLGAYEQGELIYVKAQAASEDESAEEDPNFGSSWENAHTDLQAALTNAPSGSIILVSEGTYIPGSAPEDSFQLTSGVILYGGFPAEATDSTEFDERNPFAYPTILSGDHKAYHVLTADGTNSLAQLDGFTITAGNANGGDENDYGGGLYCVDGALPVIVNCSFHNNSASQGGGAIFNDASSPTLINCSFQGNHAGSGGAILNDYSSPALTNCSLQGNYATEDGGAIFNWQSTPILINCILWNNAESGVTSSQSASIFNHDSGPIYFHTLVQNWHAGGFDGTTIDNNPLFLSEVNPLNAPSPGGDLRLAVGSPAINAGDSSANTSSTDLLGKPRFVGTIDLGAYEANETTILWATDHDGDRKLYGLELIVGTDPDTADTADSKHFHPPSFDENGDAVFTFGLGEAPEGTTWTLTRSTDLSQGSFQAILTFADDSFTLSNPDDSYEVLNGMIAFTDANPPSPQAFYRLEAQYIEPTP